MNFTALDNNGKVEGYAIIKTVEVKTSSKGDMYLDFTLSDKTGEINAKLWRYEISEHGTYQANDIVKIRGSITQYAGSDQLRIDRIRKANETDNITVDELVRSAAYSSEDMYSALTDIADTFSDEQLKLLVKTVYTDNRMALLYWPAAFKLHHALRGGLLMHVLSIVRLCEGVCRVYPFVDRDLLITGAMLHDIAKTEEFTVPESGIAEGYSIEGNLLGHLTMGAEKISKYCEKLGIDKKTETLVKHMILSHHGEPEFGAAVRPMFIEAELLSELDLMDSRIYEMKEALYSTPYEDFSARMWALDNRKLFNHSRTDLDKEPNLL